MFVLFLCVFFLLLLPWMNKTKVLRQPLMGLSDPTHTCAHLAHFFWWRVWVIRKMMNRKHIWVYQIWHTHTHTHTHPPTPTHICLCFYIYGIILEISSRFSSLFSRSAKIETRSSTFLQWMNFHQLRVHVLQTPLIFAGKFIHSPGNSYIHRKIYILAEKFNLTT